MFLWVSVRHVCAHPEWMISPDLSYTEYFSDLNLGEGVCIFTSFHFPDSGLYLLNDYDFSFDTGRSSGNIPEGHATMSVCFENT